LKKIVIAAVSRNNIIGKEGKVPWHSKEELLFFKKNTIGFPVIMGRKTWESIGRPLEGRLNIVITSNSEYTTPYKEVIFFYSLKEALNFCMTSIYEKIYIIGGATIFREAIDEADEMLISEMNFDAEGEITFPETDLSGWVLESDEVFTDFTVHHYIRK
jgi:dihydrofolate reductase